MDWPRAVVEYSSPRKEGKHRFTSIAPPAANKRCPCQGSFLEERHLWDWPITNPSILTQEESETTKHAEPAGKMDPRDYRNVATSVTGFVQQLACNYIPHGYRWYVTLTLPAGKDPKPTCLKLIAKYNIAMTTSTRSRRKKLGLPNVVMLRHRQFIVILATSPTKGHPFFEEEAGHIRDIHEEPINVCRLLHQPSARRPSSGWFSRPHDARQRADAAKRLQWTAGPLHDLSVRSVQGQSTSGTREDSVRALCSGAKQLLKISTHEPAAEARRFRASALWRCASQASGGEAIRDEALPG